MIETKVYSTIKPLFLMAVGNGKATHLSVDKSETLCGREGGYTELRGDFCTGCHKAASKMETATADKGEIMAAKNSTKGAETVEVDESLADALGEATETVDPLVAKVDQAQANIDRAASLAEVENAEGLAELAKEHESLVSSMPSRGKIPDGTMTWAAFKQASRTDFRKASQAQPKAESSKAVAKAPKAEAAPVDYTKFDGVKERVDAAVGLVVDGSKLHVKTAQTARQAAEMFLDAQRRILTKDGVPDLKTTSPEAIQARKDMYEGARKILAAEGDAKHAESLVKKFRTSVQNQMSDVLVGYVRSLSTEAGREEFETHYKKVAETHPELDPAEAVFTYYDIPRLSKRELSAQNQANKNAKLKELEQKAQEGDPEAAEAVEELKTETVQEKIVGHVGRAETDIKAAIKAAKALSEEDRRALKSRIAELAMLAAEL